jgi:hypothetical protein
VCFCCRQRFRAAPPAAAPACSGSILQSDETSVRVGNWNWWIWIFHNGDDCLFLIRSSRAGGVVEEFLGEARTQVLRFLANLLDSPPGQF